MKKNMRRAEAEIFKNKRFSMHMRESEVIKLRELTAEKNMVFQDVIDRACECLANNIRRKADSHYSNSNELKNKVISIKLNEKEYDHYRDISKQYGLTYRELMMVGIDSLENDDN